MTGPPNKANAPRGEARGVGKNGNGSTLPRYSNKAEGQARAISFKLQLMWRVFALPISARAKTIFATLLLRHHNGKTGRCNPTRALLARELRMGDDAITRGVAELVKAGVLIQKLTRGAPYYSFPQLPFGSADMRSVEPVRVRTFAPKGSALLRRWVRRYAERNLEEQRINRGRSLASASHGRGVGFACKLTTDRA